MANTIIEDYDAQIKVVVEAAGERGQSTYEAWLELGNTGSVEDFLRSQRVNRIETYIHRQISAKKIWTITHGLDKFPSITVVDSGGNVVIGEVVYIDNQTIRLSFSGEFSGTAYLN